MFAAKCQRFDAIFLQPLQFIDAVYHLRADHAAAFTCGPEVAPLRRSKRSPKPFCCCCVLHTTVGSLLISYVFSISIPLFQVSPHYENNNNKKTPIRTSVLYSIGNIYYNRWRN